MERSPVQGPQALENLGLSGKFKVCCCHLGFLPLILWSMLVYTITMTRVKAIGKQSYLQMVWCTKLTLPTTSLINEFKVAKARLFLMIRDCSDPVAQSVMPEVSFGKKWKVREAVGEAGSRLQLKEIIGHVQQDCRGFRWNQTQWWSRCDERGNLWHVRG